MFLLLIRFRSAAVRARPFFGGRPLRAASPVLRLTVMVPMLAERDCPCKYKVADLYSRNALVIVTVTKL
jgi:hypothetical protein